MSKTNKMLWVTQAVLALLFVFAGVTKLVLPAAVLAKQATLPVPFLRFIGVCETLGAAGLILPSALRIKPVLTPLAAGGLVIIMIGATAVTIQAGQPGPALFPAVVGLLAAFIAYGRSRIAPLSTGKLVESPPLGLER
jgi:DoxX-like family